MQAADLLTYILGLAAEDEIFFVGNTMSVSAEDAAAALTLQCPSAIQIMPCKDGALLVVKTVALEKYRDVIIQVVSNANAD